MFDILIAFLIPQTKFGLVLWGIALVIIGLVVAALTLGWAILT